MLQRQGGVLVAHVDGEDHTGVFGSQSEDWYTRRRILTPAFSAHKMKLVRMSENELTDIECAGVKLHLPMFHVDFVNSRLCPNKCPLASTWLMWYPFAVL